MAHLEPGKRVYLVEDMTQEQTSMFWKWIDALQYGDYKQGKARLTGLDKEGNECDCCLGVAAKLLNVPRTLFEDHHVSFFIYELEEDNRAMTPSEYNRIFASNSLESHMTLERTFDDNAQVFAETHNI